MAHIAGYTTFGQLPLAYFAELTAKSKDAIIEVLRQEEDEEPERWNQVVDIFRETLDVVSELSPEQIHYLTNTEHLQEDAPDEYIIKRNLTVMKRFFQGRWPTMNDFFRDFVMDEEEEEGEEVQEQIRERRSPRLRGENVPDFAQLRRVARRMNPARLESQSSQSATIRLSDGQDYDLQHILDIYRHSNGQRTLVRHELTDQDRALMTAFLRHNDYDEQGRRLRGGRRGKKTIKRRKHLNHKKNKPTKKTKQNKTTKRRM
jgi:hypothetical protein